MEKTYTYTARSAENPEQVVTFTFYDRHLLVDVGVPIEHMERALQARQAKEGVEDEEEKAAYHVQPWLKPMAISAIERTTHPFNVSDVYADVDEERLSVTAWVRAGGLRLAPVTFNMAHVDNLDAARAFVKQLEARRADSGYPGRFPGLLDYWATWAVGALSTVVLLGAWLRKRYKDAAA
jgi:hypothetical protein